MEGKDDGKGGLKFGFGLKSPSRVSPGGASSSSLIPSRSGGTKIAPCYFFFKAEQANPAGTGKLKAAPRISPPSRGGR